MAGIYIHIPFCKKACHYCNFHFSTSLQKAPDVIKAIQKEIELRAGETQEEIKTIYFGGGTPSLVDADAIASILEHLQRHFKINQAAEITLEANPDDITFSKANQWKKTGINRFSLGIQSFSDENLEWMNRAHNAKQSTEAIEIIRAAGFENMSIDLIYGTPGQSASSWINDIETAVKLKIPHLSCYALTVEDKTALQHLIEKGEKQEVNPDEQAERFIMLMNKLESAGYHHYEISNFAKPGLESKHNSAYWDGSTYIGLGPSAHSFDGKKRKWNVSNNMAYIQGIQNNSVVSEEEILTQKDRINEYCMTAIRRSEGIEKLKLQSLGGDEVLHAISEMIQQHVVSRKVIETDEGWRLSNEGKFFADGIASSLFFLDNH